MRDFLTDALNILQVMEYDIFQGTPSYHKLHNNFPHKRIYEDEDSSLVLEFGLAGYKKEELSVILEKYKLIVSADCSDRKEDKIEIIHNDLKISSFRKAYSIPEDYNQNSITSKFEDGILQIRICKNPEAKPLNVKIS